MGMRPEPGDTIRVTVDDEEMHLKVLATEDDLIVVAIPRRARWTIARTNLYVWVPDIHGAWCYSAEREPEETETAWVIHLIGIPFHVQRRRHVRTIGDFTAVLQVGTRSLPCRVVDHSAGGLRCAVSVGADVREGDDAILVLDEGDPVFGTVLRTEVVGSELHVVVTW